MLKYPDDSGIHSIPSLVVTDDTDAHLAVQLLSVRYTEAINVVVGLTNCGTEVEDVTRLHRYVRDKIAPAVKLVDSLPPVDWERSCPQLKQSFCYTFYT